MVRGPVSRVLPRAVAAMVLAAVCSAVPAPPARSAEPPPTFELPLLDGSKFVQLADFGGRAVLLNFWGSECPPCVKEMPLLFAQAKAYPGVQFLGIAVDEKLRAERFLARLPPGYPQLIAPRQPEVLMRRFGNRLGALPFTVLLDARHRVCASRLGEVDAPWIELAVKACTTDGQR